MRWKKTFMAVSLILILFSCQKKNPYVYDLEAGKKVDPSLICYMESPGLPAEDGLAMAFDRKGFLYLAEAAGVRVIRTNGETIASFPVDGKISALAWYGERLYLALEEHLELFTPSGERIDIWSSLGEQALITSLSVSGAGVFVADAGNHLVMHYSFQGHVVNMFRGEGSAGIIIPSPYFEVAALSDGLWLVNPGRHRLERYDLQGNLVSHFGKTGLLIDSFSGCCNPIQLALLPDGDFLTAEKGIPRVKRLSGEGILKCVVAPPVLFSDGTVIRDLAVSPRGDVFVLESSRIRIFTPL